MWFCLSELILHEACVCFWFICAVVKLLFLAVVPSSGTSALLKYEPAARVSGQEKKKNPERGCHTVTAVSVCVHAGFETVTQSEHRNVLSVLIHMNLTQRESPLLANQRSILGQG